MKKSKFKVMMLAGAVASLMIVGTPNQADAAVIAAGPGAFAAGFATPVAVGTAAAPLTFVNGDIQPHNVIATANFLPKADAKKTAWCKGYAKTKCPLFWSATVGTGGQTPVLGLENLESGVQYPFFCSIHPGMKGTLVGI
jgi:plastocyanin